MSKVYFISVNNLKEETTISWAIEDKLIETSIWNAQQIDIQSILGTNLYTKISNEIEASTLSGVYKTLMDDYIYYTLIQAAQKRSLIYIFSKIREKGIITKDDPGSTSVDVTILNKMRDEISSDFAFYANQLKEYLCDNVADFPEYSESNTQVSPDKTDSYFCGLYLG